MSSPVHVCVEIRGDKILLWSPKRPHVTENDRHPLYQNHRAFKVVAGGGGGRPAYAKVERPWRVVNRDGLRELASERA